MIRYTGPAFVSSPLEKTSSGKITFTSLILVLTVFQYNHPESDFLWLQAAKLVIHLVSGTSPITSNLQSMSPRASDWLMAAILASDWLTRPDPGLTLSLAPGPSLRSRCQCQLLGSHWSPGRVLSSHWLRSCVFPFRIRIQ